MYFSAKHLQNYGAVATFRPSIRAVESGIVSYKTSKYNRVESDNFIIKYDNVDEETLNLVIETAEHKYQKLIEIFNYKFDEKVEMVVYNDVNTMMDTTMLKGDRAPMGVYFGDSIHIYNPIHWVEEHEDIESVFYNEGPVLHELAHKYTDHMARGNFPTWFTEGVSLYLEYMVDKYEWGRGIELDENLYSLENLNSRFHDLDAYYAYTQSFRIIKKYVEDNGLESLINEIEELGNGKSINIDDYMF